MLQILEEPEIRVYTLQIGDSLSLEETQSYLDLFSRKVGERQPFGCVFQYVGGVPKKTRAGQKLENDWLKAHKAELAQECFGLAMISNPGVVALLQKIVAKGLGKKLFGCEVNHFYDKAKGIEWLKEQQRHFKVAGSPSQAH
jgi:hypothetical protein